MARLAQVRGSFTVLSVVEPPVADQLGAVGLRARLALMRAARLAMALHVIVSDAIACLDSAGLHQPIKQSGGVAPFNGGGKTVLAAAVAIR